jgi:hypothetical protein
MYLLLLLGVTTVFGQYTPQVNGAANGPTASGAPAANAATPANDSRPAPSTAPAYSPAPSAAPVYSPAPNVAPASSLTPNVAAAPGTNGPAPAGAEPAKNSNGKDSKDGNGKDGKDKKDKPKEEEVLEGCFFRRLLQAECNEFKKKDDDDQAEERPRRALPSPWSSPPFPGSEYQGYPLLGVPYPDTVYPFMKAIYSYNTPLTDSIKDSRIKFDAWVTSSGNWSTARNSNVPTSYWIVPNRYELDQMVFRLERYADTVQTDHIDYGFRLIGLYGMDYRYTTAGGWGSDQLLKHNLLYGWDPTEVYFNVYVPGFLGGTDIRVGRWIACPDIETQYAPDNYMGSHSILFTYDTYTQTGVMLTQKLNDQWQVQAVVHSGTDMAPWYKGSLFSGAAGVRWVALDNNNAVYAWLNSINSAEFRHFQQYGQPLGHDNFNYFVATWEHRFNPEVHTKTEAYYMWQRNAEVGGTPSAGPAKPFGGGGGDGVTIPGYTQTWGVLNYTMFGLTKADYVTLRNEVYRDDAGMRTGFKGTYTSHTIGLSHNFNAVLQIRPEIGYYRNWDHPAFDLGTRRGLWLYGFDMTLRF